MVFVDVTGSCRSAKNTGMQRATRGLFRHLALRTALQPICWNVFGNCYQLLGKREFLILEQPFRAIHWPLARPDLRGEDVLAELHRLFFRKSIRLTDELDADDVLLVPDIYRDGRLKKLPATIAATSARTVAIFHDAAALRLELLSAPQRRRFQNYIDSLAAFDLVICVSQDSRDDLHRLWKEHGTRFTETCVESWPVEFDENRHDPLRRALNLLVCVGSFEARKNHLRLLQAVRTLWDEGLIFDLALIGRSTSAYGRRVIPALKRLRRAGYAIRWLQHVDDLDLHRAYRECMFTIYPSRMEGFGLPIAESLWHGKPCVCGGNGALGEVARGGGCLIVDQSNAEALAGGIKKLLTDRPLYARLCDEARARKFRSWADYIDKLLGHLHATSRVMPVAAVTSH
jgi:glycosyltransferase involved in cell wall biosynthesis